MTQYWNEGKKGELDFCKLVEGWGGATLVHDLDLQHQDIDCIMNKDGRSVSVKDQHSADKFKAFMFEFIQIRTSDGATIQGNIHNCQADLYAICSPSTWFIFDAPKLKEFIHNTPNLTQRSTGKWAEENNRKVKGVNCYDRTTSYVLSYAVLRSSGTLLWEGKRIK